MMVVVVAVFKRFRRDGAYLGDGAFVLVVGLSTKKIAPQKKE
jgi:hypothetical protein